MMMFRRLSIPILAAMSVLAMPAVASDIGSSAYSETAASNNSAPPNGWPAGMNPAQVHPAAREMMAGIKRWFDRIQPVKTSGGAANVQTLTYDVADAAYVTGAQYSFIAGFTNTGAVTLNINALGAKAVQLYGSALVAGDIVAARVVTVYYDGTQFQIINNPRPIRLTSVTKTADYTILATESGTYFDNTGASSGVGLTLPAYEIGLRFCFIVTAAQNFQVIAPASNQIAIGHGANSVAAGNIVSSKLYSTACVFATPISNQWAAERTTGLWAVN